MYQKFVFVKYILLLEIKVKMCKTCTAVPSCNIKVQCYISEFQEVYHIWQNVGLGTIPEG